MTPDLIAYTIAGLTMILGSIAVFGFPALTIVIVKYFKFKERELEYLRLKEANLSQESEYREKSQHQQVVIEQRVQKLEDVLVSLDRDVRNKLGIEQPSTPLQARPELVEGPAATEEVTAKVDPARVKAR
jgi:hypothetical protein